MKLLKILSIALMAIMLSGCFPAQDVDGKKEVHLQGRTMGSFYNVKVIVENDSVDLTELHQKIDAALVKVNQEMSTYMPDSELSLFNKSDSTEVTPVSDGLRAVIAEALRIGHMTGGSLDVTVGPLVNLWGFGPEMRPEQVPTEHELAQATARVGIDNLSLTEEGMAKSIPNLYIDLSTIAKGWGVDVVADVVEQYGYHDYLVEVGGEMRVKGFKHDGTLWVVAIEKPISTERSVQQFILPKDSALATSGDYRNYFEVDGVRYSHIIDPRTSKPLAHNLVSVSVIHSSSMTADALSTALMVMGAEKGYEFAEANDIAALFISKSEHGFTEQITVKFMPYLK